MTTYVMRRGRLVDKRRAPSAPQCGVYVISDEMAPTRHMADSKFYTSKAKFRRATRDAGCVEVGNETATMLRPRKPVQLSREQRRRDIRTAIEQLRAR